MNYVGSIIIANVCSRDECSERPVAVAPWQTSQLIFLCREHADEICVAIDEEEGAPLTGIIRWIVPTCQALVEGTTPCGAASTLVSVFTTADDFKTSCMCDRHTAATARIGGWR